MKIQLVFTIQCSADPAPRNFF